MCGLGFCYEALARYCACPAHAASSSTHVKQAFAYHIAGVVCKGCGSVMEGVIMREDNANSAWTAVSDRKPERRTFCVQNRAHDVIAVDDAEGKPLERVRYMTYDLRASMRRGQKR
jgi:transcription elongation factor Elf1